MVELALRGRSALVTGASSGLGLAAATALAAEGCRLAICARGPERLAAARQTLLARGAPEVWAWVCDIDRPTERAAMLDEVAVRLGRVEAVVANCGNPTGGWVDAVGEPAWEDAWAKARAIMEVDRWAAGQMAARSPAGPQSAGGAIVNVLSRTAIEPDPALALSSLVRAALLAWGKMLASRCGDTGVRVVSVLPGTLRTQGILRRLRAAAADPAISDDRLDAEAARRQGVPLGRLGGPEAFGRLVAFLASPACEYVSGSAVRFDGGAVRAP